MGAGESLAMLPWFPGSFLNKTRGWSVTAKGVYRELLDSQWALGVLPDDPEKLRQLIGATESEWADGWARCAEKFARVIGGLQNDTLELHRAESVRLRERRRIGAEKTHRKRAEHRAEQHAGQGAEQDAEHSAGQGAEHHAYSSSSLLSSPDSGVPSGNSRPQRTARPAYEGREFHEQVIAAYHELLPEMPRVKVWSDKRRKSLNSRIRERLKENKDADGLDYWRRLFAQVAASDFLCARGGSDFCADLEWILQPKNFVKVIEGKYNRRSNGGMHAR
jgi:uncharacterized protein YdaU (DUF1376 family)